MTFLTDSLEVRDSYTFSDLDQRARAIAARLQREESPGARIVLLFKPGIEFLAAFMGCQYAAMVAVPVQPPAGMRFGRRTSARRAQKRVLGALQRFALIAKDADASTLLTTSELADHATDMTEQVPALAVARWIAVDEIDDSLAEAWQQPVWEPDALSLLQYTSGSTSDPKGVAVAQKHLTSNATAINDLGELRPQREICVSWLPATHDMGLIGCMLFQILSGSSQVQLSPMTFLKRPLTWLRAISENQATLTAVPNFALELCVAKTTEDSRRNLDLSSLRIVVVGGEPVRADTVRRFIDAFEPCGLNPEAIFPCYGLAESTLIVTGRRGLRSRCFDREGLRHGKAVAVNEGSAGAVPLVSCGSPVGDAILRIVDPESLETCPEGGVGEIWVASSHVAEGYFGHAESSAATFGARLGQIPGAFFLRTGDTGVIYDQEVFVTGRYKDLMVFSGANHHPQDIEQTVASTHAPLRADRIVAFSVDADDGERLVIGVEMRDVPPEERPSVSSQIRHAVLAQHGLNVHTLVALDAGALTKTPSGKPQRYIARQRFQSGELGEVT